MLELPIRGRVAGSFGCSTAIEVTIPIREAGPFCIHFGGELEIADPSRPLGTGTPARLAERVWVLCSTSLVAS